MPSPSISTPHLCTILPYNSSPQIRSLSPLIARAKSVQQIQPRIRTGSHIPNSLRFPKFDTINFPRSAQPNRLSSASAIYSAPARLGERQANSLRANQHSGGHRVKATGSRDTNLVPPPPRFVAIYTPAPIVLARTHHRSSAVVCLWQRMQVKRSGKYGSRTSK